MQPEPSSFRDPFGQIFQHDGRIFRKIQPFALADFSQVTATPLFKELIADGWLVDLQPVSDSDHNNGLILEHPRLPFISYPYEWPFAALKSAALFHLDIHLRSLQHGVTLIDASAYNIQFRGTQPIFIDHLSFRPYVTGSLWQGYKQFCEQFLYPLLLSAYLGIPYHAWYRGKMQGISALEMRCLLPWWRKCMPKAFLHIFLQASLQNTALKIEIKRMPNIRLPLTRLQTMLQGLRNWIAGLQPRYTKSSQWSSYAQNNSYGAKDAEIKATYVQQFIQTVKPKMVWDMGCNSGEYASLALQAGAQQVIGFDADLATLDRAWRIAQQNKLAFLPLFHDLTNPSPNQGWMQHERYGLQARGPADALLALALMHHLAIANNIPLTQLAKWLVGLAANGLIEFVPKSDPMVQILLAFRQDIFADYSLENFLAALKQHTSIIKVLPIGENGRSLIWYGTAN